MACRLAFTLALIVCFSVLQSYPQQDPPAITNNEVMTLLKSGLSPEVVIAKIKVSPSKFDTSVSALQELKTAGVPDNVILTMIQSSAVKPESPQTTAQPTEQVSEIPLIFIDAQQGQNVNYDFWNGLHTDNDLNTVPEIARMLTERGREDGVPLGIVFERDKADLVWVLGREKKWNSKMYTWNLVDRITGQAWAYGKENWFRNAVKDTVKFIKVTWGMKKAGMEAGELAKKYPVKIDLPKKIKKGENKDNIGKVTVSGTANKATVRVVAHNPDIATFSDGSDEILISTGGGEVNSAQFRLAGSGKKGMCYFNAFVVAIE